MSGRLAYLLQLYRRGELAGLVDQELAIWRRALESPARSKRRILPLLPSPLTAPVRLLPESDPVLHIDSASLRRRFTDQIVRFDPEQPAVAVSVDFLGSLSDMLPLGLIPISKSGDIVVGWVNLERVAALSEHRAVLRIDTLRVLSPNGTGIGTLAGDGPVDGGAGVRLACIDMGFDFLHPGMLQGPAGQEQVRAIWLHDMVVAPPPGAPPASSPGRRFTGPDLGASLQWYDGPAPAPGAARPDAVELHLGRLRDPPGNFLYKTMLQQHGTAVVGIAAGDGRGPGPGAIAGVAPAADLLLVALGAHDEQRFADCTQVAAAFDAVFADASAPCVALMANSDNLGPHDGSLPGERALDEWLLSAGRAIVLTAGNLNQQPAANSSLPRFHAVADFDSGNPPQPFILHYLSGATWPDSAEVWFRTAPDETASAQVSMRVRNVTLQDPPPILADNPPVDIFTPAMVPFSYTTVTAHLERDDDADAWCLRLFFRPDAGRSIAASVWTITVTGTGVVHAWLDRNNEGIGQWEGPTATAGDDRTTLGSPSTAMRPLVVGSVTDATGLSSVFSGHGPVREEHGGPNPKPDIVAQGEHAPAPVGSPGARWLHTFPQGSAYSTFLAGTSYAAPRIAGACALLFQRWGAAATWADIRQGMLQAATRTAAMPAPDPTGWDSACGFGMLDDLTRLPLTPAPAVAESFAASSPVEVLAEPLGQADLWLPKGANDYGIEPYVAFTFWNSPALVLLDAKGLRLAPAAVAAGEARPARLQVTVGNRGGKPALDGFVEVWWAPLGTLHPLPRPGVGGGGWRVDGFGVDGSPTNRRRLNPVLPGGTECLFFDWAAPNEIDGSVEPHMLLATLSCPDDPFDPADTLCAQNNAAALSVAVMRGGECISLHLLGSDDVDSLTLWHEDGAARLTIVNLPVAALPWRDAAIFQESGSSRRPLHGDGHAASDPARRYARRLEGADAIVALTDVIGAQDLKLQDGCVTIEAGGRLVLPRLRITEGAILKLQIAVTSVVGELHALHLSGGRRVGGCTIRMLDGIRAHSVNRAHLDVGTC